MAIWGGTATKRSSGQSRGLSQRSESQPRLLNSRELQGLFAAVPPQMALPSEPPANDGLLSLRDPDAWDGVWATR